MFIAPVLKIQTEFEASVATTIFIRGIRKAVDCSQWHNVDFIAFLFAIRRTLPLRFVTYMKKKAVLQHSIDFSDAVFARRDAFIGQY